MKARMTHDLNRVESIALVSATELGYRGPKTCPLIDQLILALRTNQEWIEAMVNEDTNA